MRFTTKYAFSHRHQEIVNYLDKLYSRSYKYYMDNIYRKGLTTTLNIDLDFLTKSMEYLTDYLYYYDRYFPKHDFDRLFDNLKNRLNIITVLPKDLRIIFGEYLEGDKAILINPQIPASKTLTGSERSRLYLYHELGHVTNGEWIDTVSSHIDSLDDDIDTKQLMSDGFDLLDEVTAQERAESITYFFLGKRRPDISEFKGPLFDGEPFSSNFDYYGDMEEPAYMFARTLRGVGHENNMADMINNVSFRAVDPKFVDRIFNEYKRDGHLDELYLMLAYMGIIKNASYAKIGYGNPQSIVMSKMAREELDRITLPLRDYRKSYNY